jgi:hypothetical protein
MLRCALASHISVSEAGQIDTILALLAAGAIG